jgi:hypothetical protein
MGYSAGKFYGRLTNHSNQWPTRGSIVGPWYLYSVGFRNSEAYTADTLVYALTYANVLGIYTTGLYEINAITHDFTKVADIEVQTSGNRMVLRCNVADLAARRGFQPWPNQCGYLCSAKGETRSANAAMESWQHDTTNSSRFYVNKTPVFTVGQNTAPVLANPRVIPTHGMPGTEFRFTVRYTDADTHLPVRHSVVVDSDTFDLTPDHHGYWSIVTFEHARQFFTIGAHEFRFVFNDGMAVVTTPPDTFIVDDTLAVADESPAASGQSLSAVPNPFTGTTTIRLSPIASRSSPRILRIFDDCGKLIRSFDCSLLSAPSHLAWDARGLPAGTYFLREGNGPVRRLLVKLVH